jgi:predicted dehydrogenase
MPPFPRRRFLRLGAAVPLAFPFVRRSFAAAAGSNADIRVAVIGLGGKGGGHVRNLLPLAGARLTALCDVDPARLAAQVAAAKAAGQAPAAETDPRRVLARADVDAVVIATPNHWHAPLAIWACRAGKDVYVEKPVSHSLWEGAQLAAVARQTGRVVQAGTQYRSDEGLRAAAAWLREGHIGRPRSAHIVWYEQRNAIGRAEPHRPSDLDYDLYCGPAPLVPLTRPRLHYDWHWVWSTGNGDLGNSGVHPIDACRMLVGGTDLPRRVRGLGGRFAFDDAGETPNTQLTLVEFADFRMLVENRNLPQKAGVRAMDQLRGIREGICLDCEGGSFVGLRGGGSVFDRDGKRIRQFPGDGGGRHMANFLDAVRARRPAELQAPIAEGHVSSAVCHLGNLSWRLGRPAAESECAAALATHPGAPEAFAALERHLAANGVDAKRTRFVLGPELEPDAEGRTVRAAGGGSETLAAAQALARGTHRAPYGFEPA